jgi:hypothetical protein
MNKLSHKRIKVGRTNETGQNNDPANNTIQLGKGRTCWNSQTLYYFITVAHNCQVLKKIELPLTPEKLSLLPSPAHWSDGTFRIRMRFTVHFGRQEHQHKTDAWKIMEPHIQHIYLAARIMAESYMELPDLNCTRSDVRTYIH